MACLEPVKDYWQRKSTVAKNSTCVLVIVGIGFLCNIVLVGFGVVNGLDLGLRMLRQRQGQAATTVMTTSVVGMIAMGNLLGSFLVMLSAFFFSSAMLDRAATAGRPGWRLVFRQEGARPAFDCEYLGDRDCSGSGVTLTLWPRWPEHQPLVVRVPLKGQWVRGKVVPVLPVDGHQRLLTFEDLAAYETATIEVNGRNEDGHEACIDGVSQVWAHAAAMGEMYGGTGYAPNTAASSSGAVVSSCE